ncbi:MAG: VWA domain-containing protein, partial [Gammaproteobacteria bacterium]|nr:VWA domain-containing protein [Gammaproteobacteria bacterium]
MLLGFLEHLRRYRVPVSLREFIDLLALLRNQLVFADQDEFYFMSRLALVKDEKFYDRFDQAFTSYFDGVDRWVGLFDEEENDVRRELARMTPDDGESRVLLKQYEEHVAKMRDSLLGEEEVGESGEDGEGEGEGGEEGNGDGGEAGEGDDGEEGKGDGGERGEGVSDEGQEGERTEEVEEKRKRATKVWLDREYVDYDPDVELGTRNLKLALRRLRRWAREAADLELDLHDTISSTARNGGILDIKEVPERHNAIKVLMLFDVGGSMDEHVELCGQLFSAARSEFKHLEYYYFHNFIYEAVWQDNERRFEDKVPTWDLLQKYGRDYKVILVGDADMGRHELAD